MVRKEVIPLSSFPNHRAETPARMDLHPPSVKCPLNSHRNPRSESPESEVSASGKGKRTGNPFHNQEKAESKREGAGIHQRKRQTSAKEREYS